MMPEKDERLQTCDISTKRDSEPTCPYAQANGPIGAIGAMDEVRLRIGIKLGGLSHGQSLVTAYRRTCIQRGCSDRRHALWITYAQAPAQAWRHTTADGTLDLSGIWVPAARGGGASKYDEFGGRPCLRRATTVRKF
jgi:hypothetical protein